MPFKVEIIENYFGARLNTGGKSPPFYVVKFIAFWCSGMVLNDPDKTIRHRNEPHAVLELSYWSIYLFIIICLPVKSQPPLVLSLLVSEIVQRAFCDLTKVSYENYSRKLCHVHMLGTILVGSMDPRVVALQLEFLPLTP